MSATSGAIAYEETGDMAFDELHIQVGEQEAEVTVGRTVRTSEQAGEGVEDDKSSIDALNGREEVMEVIWE